MSDNHTIIISSSSFPVPIADSRYKYSLGRDDHAVPSIIGLETRARLGTARCVPVWTAGVPSSAGRPLHLRPPPNLMHVFLPVLLGGHPSLSKYSSPLSSSLAAHWRDVFVPRRKDCTAHSVEAIRVSSPNSVQPRGVNILFDTAIKFLSERLVDKDFAAVRHVTFERWHEPGIRVVLKDLYVLPHPIIPLSFTCPLSPLHPAV
ncbi:hypothetical protein NEOLEDRAFT_1148975 [Neolentinus lepideus HHB14362 ss-1]|uniref:Uncharacterized protein n=1 Tax=Neolentinus lepideus HHB14362 ss-1 TaxID=1314782 RepID=A0A165RJ44_9AGAM|nr:hypothetical protein NEOLEDRAFT_1148975 [Neolentinus lepideus HHB14362 ss-1]